MAVIKRTASAHWEGSGKDGKGTVSTASTVLNQSQYSFKTRFEDGIGTNPEELIAAAHAGCFAMQLAFNLQGASLTATALDVACEIVLDSGTVTHSNLTLRATVPGADQAKFDELVAHAKANCPISKLLNAEITLDAQLA
ncbi:MAG: OsmC family protein [Hymenobacteraceae bacterium]|nr:OsmC family protein [Hymenobacteraceae bacterium]